MLISLLKGSGVIALGTLLGQGIVFLVTPWLSRTYSPAEFGELAILMSCSNLAMTLACGRYDLAIPSASDEAAPSVFRVAMAFATMSAVLTFVVLSIAALFGPRLPVPLGSPLLVAGCVLFAGAQQAVIGLHTQSRRYQSVAAVRFSQGALFSGLACLSGVGLLVAHALSFISAVPRALRATFIGSGGPGELRATAMHYRDFPTKSLPGAMLDVVAYSACIWWVTVAYGAHDAGQVSQIQRLVGAPLLVVSMSMTQVLLRVTADNASDRPALDRLYRRLSAAALVAALFSVFIVWLAGEQALSALLGSGWYVDAAFTVPITIAVVARSCVSPLSAILVTLRRFDVAIRWQSLYFVSSLVLLGMAATQLEFRDFVIAYAAHELTLYLIYSRLIHQCIGSEKCAVSSG